MLSSSWCKHCGSSNFTRFLLIWYNEGGYMAGYLMGDNTKLEKTTSSMVVPRWEDRYKFHPSYSGQVSPHQAR